MNAEEREFVQQILGAHETERALQRRIVGAHKERIAMLEDHVQLLGKVVRGLAGLLESPVDERLKPRVECLLLSLACVDLEWKWKDAKL